MNDYRENDRAEQARLNAKKAFTDKMKETNMLHELASNMVDNFDDPAKKYESTSDLLKEKMAEKKKERQVVRSVDEGSNNKEQKKSFTVNGYELPATGVWFMDSLTLIMFIFSTELSKNPKIDRILKQANFNFKDLNGKNIYPKSKSKKKKVRKRNARSRKRKLR